MIIWFDIKLSICVVFLNFLLYVLTFKCDVKQLAHSYGCFKQYEMLFDIWKVFKEPQVGLSELAKVTEHEIELTTLLLMSLLIYLFAF